MEEKSSLKGTQRPHLTKEQRLPQFIKEAEKVIKSVKSCKSNFKTVLANSRLRGSVFKKVYSLTLNVLKHYDYIQCIIKELNLLEKEKYLRSELATILIYEIIFGRDQLSGESKPIITIQGYRDDLMNAHQKLQYSDSFSLKGVNLPRYARIHTLVTTVPYVVKDLEDIGFKQIFYDEGISDEKYVELVKSLQSGTFMVDFHFKDLLVFTHGENLLNLELYQKGHIFLQDKSSCIPVHALNPEPGSAVLDACAAPGMKSLHMAAKMKNKGILLACERDKARFETLKEMIQHGGVKISKLFCKDFKLMDPDDQAHCSLDYILLDPSCSGSGMVNRMDAITDTEDSKNKDRLDKLAGFQIVLLKHALKFPSVKRVVYSTCSINEEENEYVVHEALIAFSNSFKLVPVMPEWSIRGSKKYEHGELCLRTLPEKHLTNGFFVAMFERLDGSENYIKNSQKHKGKKMKVEGENLDVEQYEENVNVDTYSFTSKKGNSYLHDSHLSMKLKEENETFEQKLNVTSSKKRNKKRLCNSESGNTEEAYEGTAGSSEELKYLLENSSKHKKKRNRYEHKNQSDCLNEEICTDIDFTQKCEKEKKHKAKDIKMKKYENKEAGEQLESSTEVKFRNSEIVVKHKKGKKHRNDSEKNEIQKITKGSEKNEFVTTGSKKRKGNKDEMLNHDADYLSKEKSKEHESHLTSFDNIETDVTKHKRKHQNDIKDSYGNTQTLMGEEIPKIHENLEENSKSLTREEKRKKHKKHSRQYVDENFVDQVKIEENWSNCLSLDMDNTDNSLTKDMKKKKHKKHSKKNANDVDTSAKFNETLKIKKMDVEVKSEENITYLLPESINDQECEPTKHKKSKKHKKHSRDIKDGD